MRTVIYLPLALSVVFVGLSGLVCRRTSPRPAAWSVTVAMAVLAVSNVERSLFWPGRWRSGSLSWPTSGGGNRVR